MRRSVRVTGVVKAVIDMRNAIMRERDKIKREAQRVSADLLKQARNRAPVREGTLIDSMSERVNDHGYNRGMTIIVTGGDTPYAMKMHEGHYQAHDPHDKGKDKQVQMVKIRRGGIRLRQKVAKRVAGGFWRDTAGNLHGRKYLTRAWNENKERYIKALERSVRR